MKQEYLSSCELRSENGGTQKWETYKHFSSSVNKVLMKL